MGLSLGGTSPQQLKNWHDLYSAIYLETAGNGPRDVCEIGWQDVEFVDDARWQVNGIRGALFVKSPPTDFPGDHGSPPHSRLAGGRRTLLDRRRAERSSSTRIIVRTGGASRQFRTALLHAGADRRRYLDLYVEVRNPTVAGSTQIFQPDASIPTDAGRSCTSNRSARTSRHAGRLRHRLSLAGHAE